MDDPIFDPWCLADPDPGQGASTADEQQEAGAADQPRDDGAARSRWRSVRGSAGVPIVRHPPAKSSRTSDADTGERAPVPTVDVDALAPKGDDAWEIDEVVPFAGWGHPKDGPAPVGHATPLDLPPVEPAPDPAGFDGWDLGRPLERATVPAAGRGASLIEDYADPFAEDDPPDSGSPVERLRSVVVPRLEHTSQRLVLARHRTALDDRLDGDPASLRFRIEPWHAPFDPPRTDGSAVLELSLTGPDDDTVVGRLFEVRADEPIETRSVPARDLTGRWIDDLLLAFVGTALSHD